MSKSLAALLWSGLGFPGAGHIYLRRYLFGLILIAAALVALSFLIAPVMAVAQQIADQILAGDLPADPAVISQQVTLKAAELGRTVRIPFWSLIGIWVLGMADAYRIGRKVESGSDGV
ncbi:MAG: hypothetical protein P8101_00250 [Candidatus Thiodiazotropha sp.]|jgi:hypothetical protein